MVIIKHTAINRYRGCSKSFFSLLIVAVIFFGILSPAGYADGSGEEIGKSALTGIYEKLRSIAVPLTAVGIVISGFQIVVTGDPATAAKAKNRIIIFCVALGIFLLLIPIVQAGSNLFHAWEP